MPTQSLYTTYRPQSQYFIHNLSDFVLKNIHTPAHFMIWTKSVNISKKFYSNMLK